MNQELRTMFKIVLSILIICGAIAVGWSIDRPCDVPTKWEVKP